MSDIKPTLLPLGDRAILLRFGEALSVQANLAAIQFAAMLEQSPIAGVTGIVPNLVSISVHYDPYAVSFAELTGQLRLKLSVADNKKNLAPKTHSLAVRFGGDEGADLAEVAAALDMSEEEFIAAHNASPLHILATGFAPGFVYCGIHPDDLKLPRRRQVRQEVPAGTVLFAAGQTAITATAIPTGWHIIGRTDFNNFDVYRQPPTKLAAGDQIKFEAAR